MAEEVPFTHTVTGRLTSWCCAVLAVRDTYPKTEVKWIVELSLVVSEPIRRQLAGWV